MTMAFPRRLPGGLFAVLRAVCAVVALVGGSVDVAADDAAVLDVAAELELESGRTGPGAVVPPPIDGENMTIEPVDLGPQQGFGEVLRTHDAVDPELIENVSAGFADGLRIQEFGLDEMPDEASSRDWFSSGRWYGSG